MKCGASDGGPPAEDGGGGAASVGCGGKVDVGQVPVMMESMPPGCCDIITDEQVSQSAVHLTTHHTCHLVQPVSIIRSAVVVVSAIIEVSAMELLAKYSQLVNNISQ